LLRVGLLASFMIIFPGSASKDREESSVRSTLVQFDSIQVRTLLPPPSFARDEDR
jgi:hypothetical protein